MPSYATDGVMVLGYDREHIRQVIRYVEPAYSFRSEGSYVNNLFQVDAELIEKYSGMNWEDNVRERIFKPLGMTHSSVDMNSFVSAPNVINLHHWIGSQVVMLPMDWKLQNWPYVGGPAGGVNSTVVDLVNWVRLHFNNGNLNGQQLISEKNAIFVHTPQTPSKYHAGQPMSYYCQGWMYRESSPYAIIWHNGESSGIKSAISFIPQEKLGVVVLTNLEGTKVPEALSWRFYDLYFGNQLRDWSAEELEKTRKARADAEANRPQPPPDPAPPLPLDDYAGNYYNPVYLEVEVERRLDQLVVTIGPLQTEILMRPWDGNTFMGSWDVFTEFEDVGFVTFTLDPGGAPVEMAIDYLNYDGCGVFERI
jgi:CubicO group peptidase (beta-lactamase class C family)